MLYLAYISFLFLGMQLINVLINALFRQKLLSSPTQENSSISVLIPARNEEDKLPHLLSDLQKSNNERLEILVYDDDSSDRTSQVVLDFASQDQRIQLIQSQELQKGWLGKNNACYQLAQKAKGKYLLFLDADVRIDCSILTDSVQYMKKYQLNLLSIFPVQIMKAFGESISVPMMNYILLTLLPLIYVRLSPFKSHAAANGQFMLFDAAPYKEVQPHHKFRNSPIEDIAIAKYYKQQKFKTACITSEKRIRCRMYTSYHDALEGFSKNVLMFFGNKRILALLFWLFSATGFVPIAFALPQYLFIYLVGVITILTLYSVSSQQRIGRNIFLFPLQMAFLIRVIMRAITTRKQKTLLWKERNIYS